MRASAILGVDADLRPRWREVKDNLVPLPPGRGDGRGGDNRVYGAFVYSGPGAIEPLGPEPELKRRFLGFTRLGSFIDRDGIGGAQIFRNRLRNPWPGMTATVYRNGKKAEDLSGTPLKFPTERGELIAVVPQGSTPSRKSIPSKRSGE